MVSDKDDKIQDKAEGNGDKVTEKPEEKAGVAEPSTPEDENLPVYMQDTAPPETKKFDYCKWALLHGMSEDDLKNKGYNPKTVYMAAHELEAAGLYHRVKKEKPPQDLVPRSTTKGAMQIYAKGASPEALIEHMEIPMDGPDTKIFEKGMKFGMSVLTLGVRVAQELTNMGVQQARPIIEMARDMRMGEAAAAKSAAGEAASLAAAEVQQNMAPYLMKIAEMGKGGEADPMKSMMVRTMEPLIQRMMSQFMPGMAGQQTPTGWVRKKE